MLRIIETFGGIGSQSLALKRIGVPFEIHRYIDFDKYSVASYNAINGTSFEPTDICTVTGADLGIVEKDKYEYLLTYSFPCQDLSVAGYGKGMVEGSDTRSSLLWQIGRILSECEEKPDWLLMENVVQVHSKKHMTEFQRWLDLLSELGYTTKFADLNGMDYGVAQSRNRCFAVSSLHGKEFEFPEGFPLTTVMKDYLEDEVDEKFYITNDKAVMLIEQLLSSGKLDDAIKLASEER